MKHRASIATILFALVGLSTLVFRAIQWDFALPHAVFYGVLIVNTFFSIQFFTPLLPTTRFQRTIDVTIAAIYIALGFSIGLPLVFEFCATILFVVATMKYAYELRTSSHTGILRKKILIDLLGALLCATVFGITIFLSPIISAWTLATVFALANIYLLLINPMYRHI